MLDAFKDVYRKKDRHVADELHRDDDPQVREHALEDDFYTGAVHDGVRVIDHVHTCSLVRVNVVGDLRQACLMPSRSPFRRIASLKLDWVFLR